MAETMSEAICLRHISSSPGFAESRTIATGAVYSSANEAVIWGEYGGRTRDLAAGFV